MMTIVQISTHRFAWFASSSLTKLYEKGMLNRYSSWVEENCKGEVHFRSEMIDEGDRVFVSYAEFENPDEAMMFRLANA